MLRVKDGVLPKNLVIAAAVANTAHALETDATITSGTDGTHMTGSLHYVGSALDVRSKNMKAALKLAFMGMLRDRLGSNYQVILEYRGQSNEHFHIEYDPR